MNAQTKRQPQEHPALGLTPDQLEYIAKELDAAWSCSMGDAERGNYFMNLAAVLPNGPHRKLLRFLMGLCYLGQDGDMQQLAAQSVALRFRCEALVAGSRAGDQVRIIMGLEPFGR